MFAKQPFYKSSYHVQLIAINIDPCIHTFDITIHMIIHMIFGIIDSILKGIGNCVGVKLGLMILITQNKIV